MKTIIALGLITLGGLAHAQSQGHWYNHAGQRMVGPTQVKVVKINRMMGGSTFQWKDQHGNTVVDSLLPEASQHNHGITATNVNGAWIYGGKTSGGARPR